MLRVYYHNSSNVLDKYIDRLREHREVELINTTKTFMPYHHFLHILSSLNKVEDILSRKAKEEFEDDKFQDMSLSELYHYLKHRPHLMRNNIVYSDEVVFIGFNEECFDVFRSREKKRNSFLELLESIRDQEEVS